MNRERLKKSWKVYVVLQTGRRIYKREIVPKDLILRQIALTIEKVKRKGMNFISSKQNH